MCIHTFLLLRCPSFSFFSWLSMSIVWMSMLGFFLHCLSKVTAQADFFPCVLNFGSACSLACCFISCFFFSWLLSMTWPEQLRHVFGRCPLEPRCFAMGYQIKVVFLLALAASSGLALSNCNSVDLQARLSQFRDVLPCNEIAPCLKKQVLVCWAPCR